VVGWVTTALYFVAALLCFRAAGGDGASTPAPRSPDRQAATASLGASLVLAFLGAKRRLVATPAPARARALWLGLAVILVLLGINKQLDLQTALTEIARKLARTEGWFKDRRPVEVAFLVTLTLGGLASLRLVFLLAREQPRGIRAVLAGAALLVGFVVLRAANFHHIHELIGVDPGGYSWNWVIEVGGLGFIIAGTVRVLRWRRSQGTGSGPAGTAPADRG
jgi:hypothetical protein